MQRSFWSLSLGLVATILALQIQFADAQTIVTESETEIGLTETIGESGGKGGYLQEKT